MPIGYDHETGGIAFISDTCKDCGEPLYFSGCDAPGCTGFGCQDCGTGCDLDFMGDDGTCAQAIAEEDQDDRDERINAERSVFGLLPIEALNDTAKAAADAPDEDEKRPFTMDDYREQM